MVNIYQLLTSVLFTPLLLDNIKRISLFLTNTCRNIKKYSKNLKALSFYFFLNDFDSDLPSDVTAENVSDKV